MTIEGGTAIVLAYVLVSTGVIIAFWWAALVIGGFIGRRTHHRREQRGDKLTGSRGALASGAHHSAARLLFWFLESRIEPTAAWHSGRMNEAIARWSQRQGL